MVKIYTGPDSWRAAAGTRCLIYLSWQHPVPCVAVTDSSTSCTADPAHSLVSNRFFPSTSHDGREPGADAHRSTLPCRVFRCGSWSLAIFPHPASIWPSSAAEMRCCSCVIPFKADLGLSSFYGLCRNHSLLAGGILSKYLVPA
jgi:hypothetical protein